jgi:hypothetical protein
MEKRLGIGMQTQSLSWHEVTLEGEWDMCIAPTMENQSNTYQQQ